MNENHPDITPFNEDDTVTESLTDIPGNPAPSEAEPPREKRSPCDAAQQHDESLPTSSKDKKQPKKRPPKGKKSTKRLLAGFLVKIGVILLIAWLIFTFVISMMIQYGNNMHPAVKDGDLIVSFRLQAPYTNAAVVYNRDGKKCVGRVIAMEDSDVAISDSGELTVNGIIPVEEVFYPTYRAEGSEITYPYHVDKGKVFILNDFRNDTNDSRAFGAIDISDIDGPILFSMRRRGF